MMNTEMTDQYTKKQDNFKTENKENICTYNKVNLEVDYFVTGQNTCKHTELQVLSNTKIHIEFSNVFAGIG